MNRSKNLQLCLPRLLNVKSRVNLLNVNNQLYLEQSSGHELPLRFE